eukprot:GHVO01038307.1.p1 GENE.GHVO01038307.1~~GHVO01038307.1.p1  ORF type:complete len:117 (-),score=2.56 GHVO01038307.1:263-613(-)
MYMHLYGSTMDAISFENKIKSSFDKYKFYKSEVSMHYTCSSLSPCPIALHVHTCMHSTFSLPIEIAGYRMDVFHLLVKCCDSLLRSQVHVNYITSLSLTLSSDIAEQSLNCHCMHA